MAPLARADASLEKWALLHALGPRLCASARAVYPLPAGGATHALLLPAANRERALRVTPDAEALVQAAALRVAFLQLGAEDAAATAAGQSVVVDVPAPEEHASHALVIIARGRGRALPHRLWVFSDDDVTVLEHCAEGRLIIEAPMSLERAAAALLAGVERACPSREAARLRKAGGARPDVPSEWTPLLPSRLSPATPGEFAEAVASHARETRAAVAAAAARAVAKAHTPDAADDAQLFSYDEDDAAWEDAEADAAAYTGEDGEHDDRDDGDVAAVQATPRGTPTAVAAGGGKAFAASSPPRKRSSPAGGGSAFARRRSRVGLTPATAAPAPRRKRIFGDATPAELDDADAQAFDTPRGTKRARRPATSSKHSGDEAEVEEDDDAAPEPASQPLLTRISQVARWVVGMS